MSEGNLFVNATGVRASLNGATSATATVANGTLLSYTLTTPLNYAGSSGTVIVKAVGPTGASATVFVPITMVAVNDAPTLYLAYTGRTVRHNNDYAFPGTLFDVEAAEVRTAASARRAPEGAALLTRGLRAARTDDHVDERPSGGEHRRRAERVVRRCAKRGTRVPNLTCATRVAVGSSNVLATTLVLRGPADRLTDALDASYFRSSLDFVGTALVNLTVSDEGSFGLGGTLTASAGIEFTVIRVVRGTSLHAATARCPRVTVRTMRARARQP